MLNNSHLRFLTAVFWATHAYRKRLKAVSIYNKGRDQIDKDSGRAQQKIALSLFEAVSRQGVN